MREDHRIGRRYTGERRCLAVAADSQKPAADRQAEQKQGKQRGDDERSDQKEWKRPNPAIAKVLQSRWHLVERHGFGEAEVDAGEEGRGRQRDNEAVDPGARRQETVDQTACDADPDRDRDGEPQRHAKDLHHAAEQDGGHAAERADGEVHLPHGERHHLREGDDDADADAAQQHIEIEFRQEVRRDDGED